MNCNTFLSFFTCSADPNQTGNHSEEFGHMDQKDQKGTKKNN